MNYPFAQRIARVRSSTVMELLRLASQPGLISFAAGLPAQELFPVEAVRAATDRVLDSQAAAALQYGETEGYRPLRELVVREMASRGIECRVENTLITSGSQQALDLVARVFLDEGDYVLTENPTYLAAIQVFQSYGARFAPVPTDDDGLIPSALPELIARHRPKLLYTIANFQNPTGRTLTLARRRELAEIAGRHGLVVVEDDPYGKLRYRGSDLPPIRSLDTTGHVIYVSTFSKTVAPGLRTGYAIAPEAIQRQLVVVKQATDLHSSSLDQRIIHEYYQANDPVPHVERIRAAYRERYAVMEECLRAELPEGFEWTHPEGGMFLWVTGPAGMKAHELLVRGLETGVVFVPGRDFFPDGGGDNQLRLNFSNTTVATIREGIPRLGRLLRAGS